jgi:hypothetical protein
MTLQWILLVMIQALVLVGLILIYLSGPSRASQRNHSPRPTNPLPRSSPAPDSPPPTGTASAPTESPLPDRFRWIFEKCPDGDRNRKET